MLELNQISKRFGKVEVLKGVTVNVGVGEVIGLVGENGAGKSTLMKILNGVHQSDSGSIHINGHTTTINGQRTSFTNVTLNGVNIQDNFIRTNALDFLPNLLLSGQVAEFSVSTSNMDASQSATVASWRLECGADRRRCVSDRRHRGGRSAA